MSVKIGVLGLGRMGLPFCERLLGAGNIVVAYDVDPARRALAVKAGASDASSAREVGGGVDVSISMLLDSATTYTALLGDDGLLADAAPGHVHLCMGTVGMAGAMSLAQAVEGRGHRYVDAPVSGSASSAQSGSVLSLIGCHRDLFAQAREIVRPLSAAQIYLGPVGHASAAKLAINAVVSATHAAVAESLNLSDALGVDRTLMYEALASSAVSSPYISYKRNGFLNPTTSPVLATVRVLHKDVALALDEARNVGCPMKTVATTEALLGALGADGSWDQDVVSLLPYLAAKSRGA
jgi:3-hydroxyisobutyrate dehydrogenase-like beta-hydroxyacid dehydrogenase